MVTVTLSRYEKAQREMWRYWREFQEANTQPVEDEAYLRYQEAKRRVKKLEAKLKLD